MTRLRLFLFLAVLAMPGAARADYVSYTQGGYGPFLCTADGGGPLPRGFVETFGSSFYLYACQRYRGDVQTATHVGRAVGLPGDPFLSVRVSPEATTEYACSSIVAGNSPVPCESGYVTTSVDSPWLGDWRNGSVTGYLPACPLVPNLTTLHACSGAYTPYDGSGLPTAVITDGIPKPGLPLGSPLKSPPTVGTDVSCVATMSNYPGVPNGGHAQWMAVYACP